MPLEVRTCATRLRVQHFWCCRGTLDALRQVCWMTRVFASAVPLEMPQQPPRIEHAHTCDYMRMFFHVHLSADWKHSSESVTGIRCVTACWSLCVKSLSLIPQLAGASGSTPWGGRGQVDMRLQAGWMHSLWQGAGSICQYLCLQRCCHTEINRHMMARWHDGIRGPILPSIVSTLTSACQAVGLQLHQQPDEHIAAQ
jgi:hypothetical protein